MTTLLGIDVDPTAHGLAGPRVAAAVGDREGFQLRQLRGNYRWGGVWPGLKSRSST